jgi:hypothetical protein
MAEEKGNDAGSPDKKKTDAKKKKLKPEEDKDADLSEEDLELKKNLALMVSRISEGDPGVQTLALQTIATEIRSATTSMTSVPKPLKFLRSHYKDLTEVHSRIPDGDVKDQLADVLSVLAITTSKEGERACLRYRLLGRKVTINQVFIAPGEYSFKTIALRHFVAGRCCFSTRADTWPHDFSAYHMPSLFLCGSLREGNSQCACRVRWVPGGMSTYAAYQER